ncbi:hypothetical protein AHAS_Ahas02G0115100 [Arachis hypogaea]
MEHQDLMDKNEESVQSIEKVSNTEDRDKMNEVEGVKSELINVYESKDLQSETSSIQEVQGSNSKGFEAEIKVNTNAQEYSSDKEGANGDCEPERL